MTQLSIDDWEAWYTPEGKLIAQSHRVPTWEILEGLGFQVRSIEVEPNEHGEIPKEMNSDDNWNEFPDRLDKIPGHLLE